MDVRAHLELLEDEHRVRGLAPKPAREAARRDFGNVLQIKEAHRDLRRLAWADDFLRDVAYALRGLRKAPAVAAVTALLLAVAIGAVTSVFTIIDTVILRKLPVPSPEQLVILTNPAVSGARGGLVLGEREHVTFGEFETLRSQMRSFSGMFAAQAWTHTSRVRFNGAPEEEVRTKFVSAEYFEVLGVNPVIGRTFEGMDDARTGAAPYAVISHALWQRRFGGDSSVIGGRMRIAKADLTIIGVAPANFYGEAVDESPDAWIPIAMQPLVEPGFNFVYRSDVMWLQAVGRLSPGVTLDQAQAEADVVFAAVLLERAGRTVDAWLRDGMLKQHLVLRDGSRGVSKARGAYTHPLYILLGLVLLVMAIACGSVATLLLARAVDRQREIDIRLAAGASRFRIFRQFLAESLVLAATAGVVGAAFAFAGLRLLEMALRHNQLAGVSIDAFRLRLDIRALGFPVGLSVLTAMAFGLAPAWHAARRRWGVGVRRRTRIAASGIRRSGDVLVICQVALSVMLLVGAGWLVRSLYNLQTADLGYRRDLAQIDVDFRNAGYELARLPGIYEALREQLSGIPGVKAVTHSSAGLLGDEYVSIGVDGSSQVSIAKVVHVGANYFADLGRRIVSGRGFDTRDASSSQPVVCVVNQAFVSIHFGTRSPIGHDLTQGTARCPIVGVVADAYDTMSFPASFADNLRRAVQPTFYIAIGSVPAATRIAIKYQLVTVGEPSSTIPAARDVIAKFNPRVTVTAAWSLDQRIRELTRQERLVAKLAAGIGGTALLIASIGLYGLMSHHVKRRRNEIGVRMALGAQRRVIAGTVLRDVAALVLIGAAIGVPASLLCARFVRSQLYGLEPTDPQTLIGAFGIISVVAGIAGYMPARRATKVDPMTALRYE